MFGGVDAARAESDGEDREHQRGEQRIFLPWRADVERRAVERIGDEPHRLHDGLQLQRDIGRGADERDQRRQRGDRLRFAVARGDEVGDGRQVLRMRNGRDAAQQRRAESEHQNRPDVDRQKVEAVARGEPDRAVIGPGRAIDAEAEHVDRPAPAPFDDGPAASVAPRSKQEQRASIAERGEQGAGAGQHGRRSAHGRRTASMHACRDPSARASVPSLCPAPQFFALVPGGTAPPSARR